MNHIEIKLQIIFSPLSLFRNEIQIKNQFMFFCLFFRWRLSFRRSTPAAHNLLLRWEATRFFLKCMPLHTSYLYISWNRRIWETTSFWRYANLYSPELSRTEVIIMCIDNFMWILSGIGLREKCGTQYSTFTSAIIFIRNDFRK